MKTDDLILACKYSGNDAAVIAGGQVLVKAHSGASVVLNPANDLVSLQRQAQANGVVITIPKDTVIGGETPEPVTETLDLNIKGKTEPEVVVKKTRKPRKKKN